MVLSRSLFMTNTYIYSINFIYFLIDASTQHTNFSNIALAFQKRSQTPRADMPYFSRLGHIYAITVCWLEATAFVQYIAS